MPYSAYSLPRVVAQQYILSAVHSEDADTVTYVATQKNMSREVLLCSLRASAAQDARKVRFFVDTARTQARLEHPNIAAPLELLEADGSWHLAVERIKGEPLDMMVNSGRVLSSMVICGLLQQLCRVCIYLDIERIASEPFSMEHVYCAGDEANDISMLTVAKVGFAPANCTEAVRGCGATIVADAEHDALAEIVAILDKRY